MRIKNTICFRTLILAQYAPKSYIKRVKKSRFQNFVKQEKVGTQYAASDDFMVMTAHIICRLFR